MIVDVTRLKNNKPDPEIFLTAAAQLKVEPSACIGVEDAVSGVDAIKAAGMFAVAIGDAKQFPKADIVLPSTAKLSLRDLMVHFAARA